MPTNVMQPLFFPDPGEITANCITAVTGKRGVVISTTVVTGGVFGTENVNVIQVAVAGARPFGFARYSGIIGDEIPIVRQNILVPLTSGAAIATPGVRLSLDASGRVIPYVAGANPGADPFQIGWSCEAAAGADLDVLVALDCF